MLFPNLFLNVVILPYNVKKENRNAVVIVVSVFAAFALMYAGAVSYSGLSPPFYTVESGSMRHSDDSRLGVIDTGDMVLVRDPSKVDIITYVEGHETGYKKFGDFGDVLIYDRPGDTAVIHRALFHAVYVGGNVWTSMSMSHYTGVWSGNTEDIVPGEEVRMSGKLIFEQFGHNGRTVTVDMDKIALNVSEGDGGYVMIGDGNFMADPVLVTEDLIIAVALHEIPWLGCIKLFVTGTNTNEIPPNSIFWLIFTISMIIVSVVAVNMLYDKLKKKKEE